MKEAADGVHLLYELVKKAHGLPIRPVKSPYIFSSDDTVCFVFEGTERGRRGVNEFKICSNSALYEAGHRSKYFKGENQPFNGMRVKLTFTFSVQLVLNYTTF